MHRFLLALFAGAALAVAQTSSASELDQGVAAFKAGRYAQAVELFTRAAHAAPSDVRARLYLASAHMSQYIPGATSTENVQHFSNAEREFQAVLSLEPNNILALESLASLNYQRAQSMASPEEKRRYLEESERWYSRLALVDPNNKVAPYSLGVLAWNRFYPELMQARRQIGMRPEDPGPLRDPAVRADLRARLGQTVEDGIRHLQRALEIDPAYDDAMAYLNLLYRERADLHDNVADYQRDIAVADDFVRRALETKKAKAEKAGTLLGGGYGRPGQPMMPVPPGSGQSATQIRVGSNVQAMKLVNKPEPVYPQTALEARIQGVVRFNVLINRDGTIQNVTLVSGHPLLVPSAVDAVRQYRYQPTLLNGVPVEVVTQVDVEFRLPG